MNSEELKKEFGLLMPSEINGFKRPDESIPSSNDFFLEIPQLISKDPVLYSTMNLIFSVILSNDKLLKQWLDTLQNVVNAQDWREVTDSLKGYMTPELKKKLDGIATGANNYVHPSSHPATMITQDATHRFVTDTEKNTWNAKASTAVVSTTANGLMPKRNGNASYIFTGDGVWKSLAWNLITGKPSTFAPSAHNHDSSYLKLSGGSLTGALNLANGIWNKIGDDVYIGDSNQSGCLCIKGVNAASGIAFVNKDNTGQIAKLTYAGGNLISSAKIQANLAGTADKATQDSAGQQINTTYVKGVTGSNATLTVTKGNGSTSSVTVNNVANATSASRIGTNSGHNGNTTGDALPYGLTWSAIYNNNFPFHYGNVISIKGQGATQIAIEWSGSDATAARIAIRNARDSTVDKWSAWSTLARITDNVASATKATNDSSNRNIVNTYATKASPAFSGTPTSPTPATSDNSTKIATTAFVRNLINQFKTDGTLGGIVGGSLTQNGWVKFSNGLILQWGTYNMNSQSVSVTFPISFFNSCLNVIGVATRANDSNGKTPGYDATSISKTGFICTNGTNHLVNLNMRYLAIGK